eukprot:6183819-Pleurochrysis_carterae.AAC.1
MMILANLMLHREGGFTFYLLTQSWILDVIKWNIVVYWTLRQLRLWKVASASRSATSRYTRLPAAARAAATWTIVPVSGGVSCRAAAQST